MTRLLHPFPPVIPQGARVLVLGMFPSAESIKAGGYCGNPRNAFWPILADVLDTPWLRDRPGWETRYMALRLHLVGLWDVVASCERADASSDQGISAIAPTDVWGVVSRLPELRGVLLNGRAAWDVFRRSTQPYLPERVRVFVCPSTSPRHAVPYEAKRAAWRRAFVEAMAWGPCPECGREVADTNGWSLYLYCPVHGPAVPRDGAPPNWSRGS